MRTDYLKTAVTVLDARSYTDAAPRLALTPTAVMCRVKTLEKELGYKLFMPGTSNGVRPTDEGCEFLFYARLALELLDRGNRVAVEVVRDAGARDRAKVKKVGARVKVRKGDAL